METFMKLITPGPIPNCGFGNKLLFYNNIRQLAYHYKCDWMFYKTPEFRIFKENEHPIYDSKGCEIEEYHEIEQVPFCLGEKLHDWNYVSFKSLFQINEHYKSKMNPFEKKCAIHIRGKDFQQWNPNAILPLEYYMNSIDHLKSKVNTFYLFTDDLNQPVVKQLINQKNIVLSRYSGSNNILSDFVRMTECDYIISSPSTFAICAGFIGKHKKIIHSKNWVNDRVSKNDQFWVNMLNKNHKDYQIEAFI